MRGVSTTHMVTLGCNEARLYIIRLPPILPTTESRQPQVQANHLQISRSLNRSNQFLRYYLPHSKMLVSQIVPSPLSDLSSLVNLFSASVSHVCLTRKPMKYRISSLQGQYNSSVARAHLKKLSAQTTCSSLTFVKTRRSSSRCARSIHCQAL